MGGEGMNGLLVFLIAFPGVALLALLIPLIAVRWFAAPADRKRTEWLLCAACLVEPMGAAAQLTANWMTVLRPLKYDLFVYQLDRLFGEPSFHLGQLVAAHLSLTILVSVSYSLLPVMCLAAFAANLIWASEARALFTVKVFLLNAFLAVPLYLLFPVCGPAFAFPSFPALPLTSVVPHLIALAAAPNGVPSVHTSTALLILFFLRRWRLGSIAGGVFLALTVLATLGSGQHYFFDLICAVPYAALILYSSRFALGRKSLISSPPCPGVSRGPRVSGDASGPLNKESEGTFSCLTA
jgi:hypothetical protein